MISFNLHKNPNRQLPLSHIQSMISLAIRKEGKVPGEITYVFCDDGFLLEINQQFLQHDTLTDIVTFPTSVSADVISGEIYISLDRVEENAKEMNVDFDQELKRVAVHGVLHLLGYEDHTADQKTQMRAKEDYYINLPPHSIR